MSFSFRIISIHICIPRARGVRWLSRFSYNERDGGREKVFSMEKCRVVDADVNGLFQNEQEETFVTLVDWFGCKRRTACVKGMRRPTVVGTEI
jgi:hypothetical protein